MTAPPNFRYIKVKSCYNCAHIEFDYDWESECGKYKLKRGQYTDFNTVCDDWEAKE